MDLLRSLPIGLYLEKPYTWLHQIDSRVKLAWLMSLIISPLLATPFWRLFLVGFLLVLTWIARIPWRVQKNQMVWLLLISILVFILTCIAPDGLAINYNPRLPENTLPLTQPTSYQYILLKIGNITITRRSLDLAVRVSTLIFTLIYSSNIYLLTTAPEEITEGIENLLAPLRKFNIPVTEIVLTLTLSLRFIPLVLEEIQNLVRSVRTRAINWKKLGIKKSLQVWLIVAEKLLENLLYRAEQIAIAMEIRGFTSPNEHQVQWHKLTITNKDFFALGLLAIFWFFRIFYGQG
jgi:energy-coupling factor transport system permease protein